jgi:hypothetical protein
VASWFGEGSQGLMFERLARVLDQTARRHCPEWDVHVDHIQPPRHPSAISQASHEWNTQKFEHWVNAVLQAPDGARIALLDGDTFLTGSLTDVWRNDFDVAYTERAKSERIPLNAGVVFVRVSERTRRFMSQWWAWNCHFLNPREHPDVDGKRQDHGPWRSRYAGINQASLGYMLERVDHGCAVKALPCDIWNCVNWDLFDEDRTRIVHVKSSLRRTLFGLHPALRPSVKIRQIITLWKAAEAAAIAAAPCA